MALRIAYVAMRWDYGDPARGPSFEETTFRSAFEGMGHDVHPYDFMERRQAIGKDAMNAELFAFVRDVDPHLAFFFLFTDEIDFHTIRSLTDSGVLTLNWFADDHRRFETYSKLMAPAFTHVVTTDPDALAKYEATGYAGAILSQWACNRYAFGATAGGLRHDVTFVGQRYGDRPKLLDKLRRSGLDVDCWGHGWGSGRLGHDEMVEVFGSSRVNLNLSGAWTGSRWRRRPVVAQIKGRTFEVPGCGGFLLTEAVPHLERYFRPGEEVAVFRNADELVAQARYWLDHEDERREVARAGHTRVLAEHTYDHRFNAIFTSMGLPVGDAVPIEASTRRWM